MLHKEDGSHKTASIRDDPHSIYGYTACTDILNRSRWTLGRPQNDRSDSTPRAGVSTAGHGNPFSRVENKCQQSVN